MKLLRRTLPLLFLAALANWRLPAADAASLKDVRAGFHSRVKRPAETGDPVKVPPTDALRVVYYQSPVGALPAYLSNNPGDKKKHPAIIWITGGDCNSIGDVWTPQPPENDQTASIFRMAGIVTMYPSLRGGNRNPGVKEGFLGEVDDVLAAARYLEKVPWVDPERIYLGGHSTGGTLALLVSECSSRFRGVFAFGSADDVSNYGDDSGFLPFNTDDPKEIIVRSPVYWLKDIKSPTWVIEGTAGTSNITSLRVMAKNTANKQVHFLGIERADHFSVLATSSVVIARKILDAAGKKGISLTAKDLQQYF